MSQPVLIKVYGSISPAREEEAAALERVCASALPHTDGIVTLSADLLRISFEGIYFPIEEVLECAAVFLEQTQTGKIDVLDIENWILNRHVIAQGVIKAKSSPLNNVLDYSGH